MKNLITLSLFILFIITFQLHSQTPNFQMDNGQIRGYYGHLHSYEESVILRPPSPGIAKKLYVYLSGTVAARDTIRVVGDPAEGSIPPSLWCQYINTYAGFIIDYPGTPGWYEFDLSGVSNLQKMGGLHTGGINAVVIQHTIKPGGPYFTLDRQEQTANNANSFLNDVYKPNPNFYNIAGTIISLTQGRYMIRLHIDYSFKNEDGSPITTPPPATLTDVTSHRGLLGANGQPVAFDMASVVDINRDGYDDISIRGNYFMNNGDGTFVNLSSKINIANSGSVWADIDNDGYVDFYAVRGGTSDRIYWGKADGTFEESTDNTFAIDAPTVSPLFLDYDGDGLLDLFIAYGRREAGGQERYFQDKLYKNLGNRKFQDVTVAAGIAVAEPAPHYDTWGATICDYNNDGKPDIFVATYRLAPDLLYKNNGDGTFTEVGASTGVRGAATYNASQFGHGMGADWGMLNDDNAPDMVVGNLSHPDARALVSNPSLVWLNDGQSTKFSDITRLAMLGFYEMNAGVVLADLNNDGRTDVAHAQYAYYKKGDGRNKFSRIYLNQGGNDVSPVVLKDITWESGALVHGAWAPVRGDFDNNGSVDLLIASNNEYVKLFDNNILRGNWISFKLQGDGKNVNRDGFGSTVKITRDGGNERLAQLPGTILNGRAGQSSNDLHFGLGNEYKVDNVTVRFQDGTERNVGTLFANVKYLINYDGEVEELTKQKPILISPANGEIIYRGNYAVFSAFAFGKYKNLTLVVYNSDGTTVNFKSLQDGDFENIVIDFGVWNTTNVGEYDWKIIAEDEDGNKIESDTWKFYIANHPIPTLISPPNNAVNVSQKPSFQWSYSEDKTAVNFQLSKKENFDELVYNIETGAEEMITTFKIEDSELDELTKYYWRVRFADSLKPNDETLWEQWSEVFNFTTGSKTSVTESKEAKFGFTNIYPNPANDNVNIEFELPYFANLSIAIFDLSGKLITIVSEAYFEPGLHSVGFETSSLTNGTYILRVTDGINIRSTKINVLR